MPSVNLDYSKVQSRLGDTTPGTDIISTPYGLSLLDIQGVLNVPKDKIEGNEYLQVDDIYDAVKFGQLTFDSKDQTKVTLIIGNSQRLVGSIVKLDRPLGVLKIPINDNETNESPSIDMIEIIRKKIVFKQRPLPIM